MKLKDISIPNISINNTRKNLRKAEKFFHNLQHILRSPKTIKDIHKWQRQKEKQVESIITCLGGILSLLQEFIKIVERLEKRDKAIALVLVQEMIRRAAKDEQATGCLKPSK